jgi:hypothetical protein
MRLEKKSIKNLKKVEGQYTYASCYPPSKKHRYP